MEAQKAQEADMPMRIVKSRPMNEIFKFTIFII